MLQKHLGADVNMSYELATLAVIGLGYVGLPLAVEFAKKYSVSGFDIDENRIWELNAGKDSTLQIDSEALLEVTGTTDSDSGTGLKLFSHVEAIRACNVYIVTVPTLVDKYSRPDLSLLLEASALIGSVLKQKDIVIYESTVYPGATEDECVPVLERVSGLKFNIDFFVGYSPERINPGDKVHTMSKIVKITSGSTPEIAEVVDKLYGSIVTAGTYKSPSIKVAEAAKVIENAQRDINIAFVNEVAKILNRLNIDTTDVLNAAGTKWNFLKFKPGLVGGHCVSIDPYYLAQKAQDTGYYPEIILAGRRLNNSMGEHVAHEVIRQMIKKDIHVTNSNILILGITFKENCPDVRNTKVVDIANTLRTYEANISIYDPWADPDIVMAEYGLKSAQQLTVKGFFDAIILAVAHNEFAALDLSLFGKSNRVIYDVKGILPRGLADARL